MYALAKLRMADAQAEAERARMTADARPSAPRRALVARVRREPSAPRRAPVAKPVERPAA